MALCLTLRRDNTIVLETSDGPVRIDLVETVGRNAMVAITAPSTVHIGRQDRCESPPPIEAPLTHAKGVE